MACVAVLTLPAMMMVGSLGLSFQSSTARLFTSTVWMSYLGLELGEAAIAEAAHCLKPEDVFDRALLPEVASAADPAAVLICAMVEDKLPAAIVDREYRDILDQSGTVAAHMNVAFRFPRAVKPRWVPVPGLARKLAAENRGVLVDSPTDLAVAARPLSFRREFYKERGYWVNWGVVRFAVTVRTRELKGVTAHRLLVDRRFTLKSRPEPGEEMLKVSSQNLRTAVVQEDL